MPTLQFMPWCRIDRAYSAGEITVFPFRPDETTSALDAPTTGHVMTILACYKDLEGRTIGEASLVQTEGRPLLAELSDDDLEVTREYLELACFCGLAKREYFNQPGPYCNADCFTLYAQRFEELDFISIRSRRREGGTWSIRPLDKTLFSIPVHVNPNKRVSLDAALLDSLVAFRKEAPDNEWSRWQNAISCFNQANTDNNAVRYHVEWVLLCSAFEHILGADPKAEDVAKRFTNALAPSTLLLVRNAKRCSAQKQWDANKPLRYEWMKEFYRIRGDFAHGRLTTRQPAVWNPLEHLVLASIAFPLLVRRLLQKKGKYQLTDNDLAQIGAFEKLVDEQFLNPPADQKGSIDSVWSRLLGKAKSEIVKQKVIEKLKANGLLDEESEN